MNSYFTLIYSAKKRTMHSLLEILVLKNINTEDFLLYFGDFLFETYIINYECKMFIFIFFSSFKLDSAMHTDTVTTFSYSFCEHIQICISHLHTKKIC